ncbi:MAG: hypothetical protein CVU56_19970 [Deltaproteobacteria bacterium HGW-Deltaproteobacteria-14]|nr:MAG: hypothetical protein CVU56_19970 [Deltaproteobacteria bacterium HGW-Deltaproteobacteria-14]
MSPRTNRPLLRRSLALPLLVPAALLATSALATPLEDGARIANDPVQMVTRGAEAERLFVQCTAESPKNIDCWYDLGLLRLHMGNPAGAAEAWRRGLSVDPQHAPIRAQLAALEVANGNVEAGLKTLEDIVAANRFQPDARNALAAYALAQGKWDEALKHSRNVLLGDPRNVDAALNAAIAYYRQGLYDQAGLIASSFLEKDPGAAALHNLLGLVFLQKDNTRKATEHFLEALKSDPGHADARLNLAALELGFGNFESAYKRFGEALADRPNDPEIVLSRAVAARGLERYDEAEQGYLKALSLRPGFPDAEYDLCVLHQQFTQRWKEAKKHCDTYAAMIDAKHPKFREMKKRTKSIDTTIMVMERKKAQETAPEVPAPTP